MLVTTDDEITIGGVSLADLEEAAKLEPEVEEMVIKAEKVINKPKDSESNIKVIMDNKKEDISENVIKVSTKIADGSNVMADTSSGSSDTDLSKNESNSSNSQNKSEIVKTLRKVYLFDFIYRTAKAKNWGLFVWLFLNFCIIECAGIPFGLLGLLAMPLLYTISLAIALSPAGEFFLRQQNACREIKNKEIKQKIQPIFDRVYAQARENNPNISPKVKLFMCDDESENAFATGRRTVCVTKGLVNMKEEHIEAILAHEFGHLAHRDTDNLLIVTVGNLFITVITTIIGIIINIIGGIVDFITSDTTLGRIIPLRWIVRGITFICTSVFMFLWTKLGTLLCMRGSRIEEYAADHYAAELGQAQNLVDAFNELDDSPAPRGLWAALTSSHPQTSDRIDKLNEYIEAHANASQSTN